MENRADCNVVTLKALKTGVELMYRTEGKTGVGLDDEVGESQTL